MRRDLDHDIASELEQIQAVERSTGGASIVGEVRSRPAVDPAVARTALWLSLASVITPMLSWAVVAVLQTVSGDQITALMLLVMVSSGVAVTGFITGILARHDRRGAWAVALGLLGFALSVITMGAYALTVAFSAMNAGL